MKGDVALGERLGAPEVAAAVQNHVVDVEKDKAGSQRRTALPRLEE